MLEFTCSSCGKRVQGDESLAGTHVQCPGCHADIAVPSPSLEPVTAIATGPRVGQVKVAGELGSERHLENQRTALPVESIRQDIPNLLMRWAPYTAIGVMAILTIGILTVTIHRVRQSAARTQSTENLRQIGVGFHRFHDVNKRLPFNGTLPAVGGDNTTGSWAFMILPFIDQQAIFATKNSKEVVVFMCPGRGRPSLGTAPNGSGAWTDYFINPFINDPNGMPNVPDGHRTLDGISDGISKTILVGHGQISPSDYSSHHTKIGFVDIIFNGGSAGLCRPNTTVVNGRDCSSPASKPGNWGGPFAEGAFMCMADARVSVFPYGMLGGTIVDGVGPHFRMGQPDSIAASLTPTGRECIDCPE